ncbi:SixA phosphatase family protein [Propionicicella superfundia]|uniref:SixA phosphatase family protein n=1 Tax=Propionicicella superfundia TaxID=348582 RepID=UPI000411FBB8|nr:histidine phosphatase family protein [Propionicicella superfundia]
MERLLTVMRHAKSSWSTGEDDIERPLASRGRRDAAAAARWLTGAGLAFDLVYCSGAIRARQTWGRLADGGVQAVRVEYADDIYHGGAGTLFELLREVPAETRRVLVVGHQPTVEMFCRTAVGPTTGRGGADGFAQGFRTSALAVLGLTGGWSDLAPGSARLVTFQTPRG